MKAADLTLKLHAADQGNGLWLAVDRPGNLRAFAGHLAVTGFFVAQQIKGDVIRVVNVKRIGAPQLVITRDAPGDDVLFTQPAANRGKRIHLYSPLCYGAHTLTD